MKKNISLLLTAFISFSLFAQTKVDAKKIGKTLDSNKDAAAVFICDMSLSGMKVTDDGLVLTEYNPEFTLDQIQEATGAKLIIAEDLKEMEA